MTQPQNDQQHKFLVRCEEAYNLVQGFLHDTLPGGPVPSGKSDYIFNADLRERVKEKVILSIEKLSTAIDRHGLEEIALSYNGGKDCLVMLILILATIHKKYSTVANASDLIPYEYKLDSIYINSETPFPELSEFIRTSTTYYHLNPITIKSGLKEGFYKYLHEINTKVKCIMVGIRFNDPYGSKLKYEDPTDHDWPAFLRIHPILHWNYIDIWDFLIGCDLKYCSMYDLGYTSLGGVNNTIPNPYLKKEGTEDEYYPAYKLVEDADNRERTGRNVLK
ncbi:uncharacterized protein RJT21DRAFT_3633 [Scheffersomyces amazonensis]|uniref:uncharacterized protein n=1 Tax=Scheffersomyces amazonensis TaxID=1078765 RepID=UPI00315D5072